jgi:hypothetical protein
MTAMMKNEVCIRPILHHSVVAFFLNSIQPTKKNQEFSFLAEVINIFLLTSGISPSYTMGQVLLTKSKTN